MLPDYVYKCLERFGNTVLSKQVYTKYGERSILNHLRYKGYICQIRVVVDTTRDDCATIGQDTTVVLEVLKKEPYVYIPLKFN